MVGLLMILQIRHNLKCVPALNPSVCRVLNPQERKTTVIEIGLLGRLLLDNNVLVGNQRKRKRDPALGPCSVSPR